MTTLYTPRLVLRSFTLVDAARVQELLGDERVAATTGWIPHPYPDGGAALWISENTEFEQRHTLVCRAMTLAETRKPIRELDPEDRGNLIGSVSLMLRPGITPEIGYWVGHPWWNNGFATEAAQAMIKHAFTSLDITKIDAQHVAQNPASGRVLQKLGMRQTSTSSKFMPLRNQTMDMVHYTLTREQWSQLPCRSAPDT